jgi:thioesterase domain-containing protein
MAFAFTVRQDYVVVNVAPVRADPSEDSMVADAGGAGGWGRSPNVSLTDASNTETIDAPEGSAAEREPLISTQWPAPAAISHPPAPTPHPPAAVPLPATRRARTAVARAWRRVLNRRSLRADLTFGEAGGDSLRLLKLVFDLETQCGIDLPLAPFSDDLRPSEMARALDRCLCGLVDEANTTAPMVFLLPAIGGDDPRLVDLRSLCRPALRVELVDLGDWPGLLEPGFDVPTLAKRLAARIATRAPLGPLLLAGWSYGGFLAVAVGAALREIGREVAFVGVLDTTASPTSLVDLAPQRRPTRLENLRAVPAWIRAGQGRERLADFIVARVVVRPLLLRLAVRLRHMWLPFGFRFHLNRRMGLRLRRDMMEAWRRRPAAPPAVPGSSVVLFRAAETVPDVVDALGWCAAYPGLRIVAVTGAHTTMLEPPHLATLCEHFVEAALHAVGGTV